MITTENVVTIIVALLAIAPGLYAAYASHQAKKREEVRAQAQSEKDSRHQEELDRLTRDKADVEAFARAREIYEDALDQLQEQIKDLKEMIRDERGISNRFRIRVMELEHTVAVLKRKLLDHGVDLSTLEVDLNALEGEVS